ncbi:MAG: SpoVR family protein [Candidatus Eisenbacteria bacterium]|uniref:SpoVR family protein n=1 Tax=Eiseniibacteriota bacterium TaxID=2212470 RepID=A0A948RUW0_UNCEI|nr:SpoVR family protein [Candidatus Eisenbacteria bacterium]MBU1948826.1 SpoVR family protein [Candidatus Eisenbacteria bacterium]MBU2691320.1 SpoVR family protein [Candidatus Eisenbacteria bacterium]
MSLPPHLREQAARIADIAHSYGLDFYPTIFEVVTWEELTEVASYCGFPIRYPHWRFGMEYERLMKGHIYGLSRIYELVINHNPCYAYLLEANEDLDQKLVMAHVYAHCDFFKNNRFFDDTDRKMINQMAHHSSSVRRWMETFGVDAVEQFIDVALSLENLIDIHSPPDRPALISGDVDREKIPSIQKLRSKEYMDEFINPQKFLEEQRRKIMEERERNRKFPQKPERDILWFLIQHAPLERWQRQMLEIIRREAYYFIPQMQTKIMNEGWATYWHSRIMTEKVLDPSEVIDYADRCAGILAMPHGSVNPYKIGVQLWRDIKERWDKGRFGKEWEECDNLAEKSNWDKNPRLGEQKIFEARRIYNDITFIDEFLTREFCIEHQLFTFEWNENTNRYEIQSRDFKKIKEKLLFSLTNAGNPIILIENGNYKNRGELLLFHEHQGVDLDRNYACDTLRNLSRVWGRPVHVTTRLKDKSKIYSHDGETFSEEDIKT